MDSLSDSVTTIITSNNDSCLCQMNIDGSASLITTKATPGKNWSNITRSNIQNCFSKKLPQMPEPELFRLFKIWIPADESKQYITNVVFHVKFPKSVRSEELAIPSLSWLTSHELAECFKTGKLSSPLFLLLFQTALLGSKTFDWELFNDQIFEHSNLIEVRESVLFANSLNYLESFINSSELKGLKSVIYKEFLTICYPNVVMSLEHFSKFMTTLGLSKEEISALFRAADNQDLQFLSFKDFMCCLVVLDPNTSHTDISADIRNRFIFRLFAEKRESCIGVQQLEKLFKYIKTYLKNFDVQNAMSIMGVTGTKRITLNQFLRKLEICHEQINLQHVLRAKKPIKFYFKTVKSDSKINITNRKQKGQLDVQKIGPNKQPWRFDVHSMLVSEHGTTHTLENTYDLKDVCSKSTLEAADITRKNEPFELNCIFLYLLETLKTLTYANNVKAGNIESSNPSAYQWAQVNSLIFAKKFIEVTISAKDLLSKENRLLEIQSPVYVLGQLCGSYADMQNFKNNLWPLGIGQSGGNILFLGNYTNRGNFGLEIIIYLLCNKCLYPDKLFLLRGNFDQRNVKYSDLFREECKLKFGKSIGMQVWNAIQDVFDCLPLAAAIDERIFLCAGGIPNPSICTIAKNINSIPVPLKDTEKNNLAWALLWNKAVQAGDLDLQLKEEINRHEGFVKNVKRGVGQLFNTAALEKFLLVNQYTHCFVTNGTSVPGFTITDDGHLVTIISCSNYGGMKNDSACVLVEKKKWSMIRFTY